MRTKILACTLLAGLLLSPTNSAFAQATKPIAAATPIATSPTAAASVGQTITLNNTSFVVNAKKQLATGVEFYTMKPASPKAKPATFLRTNNRYNATDFTQTQYEAFLRTGKLPSFGTLLETISGKDTLLHINTGNTAAVIVATDKDELVIVEFINGAQVMAMSTGKIPKRKRPSPNEISSCIDACRAVRKTCEGKATSEAGKDKCWDAFGLCQAGCSFILPEQPVSIHVIRPAMPISFY